MQQRYLYMKPALQPSEAVLLPALTRRKWPELPAMEPLRTPMSNGFVPVSGDWNGQTTALSTRVRSVGSMAGRGVLRAVGAMENPYARKSTNGFRRRAGRSTYTAWSGR